MSELMLIIILAFVADAIIGDPQNPLHPVRIIGAAISCGVKLYKKIFIRHKVFSFVFGMVLSISIIILTYCITNIIINACTNINIWFGFAVQVVLCYFIIAAKALKTESMKVYKSIVANDLDDSRKKLSYIVGRDTKHLSYKQIIKATVETIAENLSDGVTAPLIFVFIGGVPLGMAYKAVNTLDSMIGYKNDDYEYFGKFAARLDDAVNFVPARISALFMILATPITGGDTMQAVKVFIRDRYNHKSPNSAQTEAVCAGALGIELGGDSYYHGVLVHKPTIGNYVNEPEARHIISANRLMYTTTILIILAMAIISFVRSFVYV